jgi:hypothetical protein
MRSVKVTLAVGLALLVVAIGVVLSRSPLVVAGTNSVPVQTEAEIKRGDTGSCQQAGTIPQGTSAIRLAVEARDVGPRVAVKVLSGSRVVAAGAREAGWTAAITVTVPVPRVSHAVSDARICIAIGSIVEPFRVYGALAPPAAAARSALQGVNLRIEYLRPGPSSWWSEISSTAYHMGLGRAAGGTWIVFLVVALVSAVAILAARVTLEALR